MKKNVKCACEEIVEYEGKDIKKIEQESSSKNVIGGNISKFIQLVECKACGEHIQVYDRISITGNFIN